VTFAGFLSAAFGGATLEGQLSPVLRGWGVPDGIAGVSSLLLITIAISYVSLVLGELVPKRLALQNAERIALSTARALDRFAVTMRPVISLLSASTNLVVRLVGGNPEGGREEMSEEELRGLVNAHEGLDEDERLLIAEVFEAGDRAIREVMLPRTEVDFLDASTPVAKAVKQVIDQPHSRYPVIRGSADDIAGFVHVRDLFDPALASRTKRVGEIAREVLMLPQSKRLLSALAEMRSGGHHLAIVVDEYGGTAGIVTLEDLFEELVGDIRDEYDVPEQATARDGDVVEVDGLLHLDDFADETGITLPDGPYETAAGYLVNTLGRVPTIGDQVELDGHRLEVVALDGRRVSRIRVSASPQLA
jgi:putative hemolysin